MNRALRPEIPELKLDEYIIVIDHDRCTGCRHCEIACSLAHMENKINPRGSRIRVQGQNNRFFPVLAGPAVSSDHECASKEMVVVEGLAFDQCVLCRASCPRKPIFRDPDTDRPLKCDFCLSIGAQTPQCVLFCPTGALELVPRTELKTL